MTRIARRRDPPGPWCVLSPGGLPGRRQGDLRSVAMPEDGERRRGSENDGGAGAGSAFGGLVALGGPADELVAPDEAGTPGGMDEGAVGQVGPRRLVAALHPTVQAFGVEPLV